MPPSSGNISQDDDEDQLAKFGNLTIKQAQLASKVNAQTSRALLSHKYKLLVKNGRSRARDSMYIKKKSLSKTPSPEDVLKTESTEFFITVERSAALGKHNPDGEVLFTFENENGRLNHKGVRQTSNKNIHLTGRGGATETRLGIHKTLALKSHLQSQKPAEKQLSAEMTNLNSTELMTQQSMMTKTEETVLTNNHPSQAKGAGMTKNDVVKIPYSSKKQRPTGLVEEVTDPRRNIGSLNQVNDVRPAKQKSGINQPIRSTYIKDKQMGQKNVMVHAQVSSLATKKVQNLEKQQEQNRIKQKELQERTIKAMAMSLNKTSVANTRPQHAYQSAIRKTPDKYLKVSQIDLLDNHSDEMQNSVAIELPNSMPTNKDRDSFVKGSAIGFESEHKKVASNIDMRKYSRKVLNNKFQSARHSWNQYAPGYMEFTNRKSQSIISDDHDLDNNSQNSKYSKQSRFQRLKHEGRLNIIEQKNAFIQRRNTVEPHQKSASSNNPHTQSIKQNLGLNLMSNDPQREIQNVSCFNGGSQSINSSRAHLPVNNLSHMSAVNSAINNVNVSFQFNIQPTIHDLKTQVPQQPQQLGRGKGHFDQQKVLNETEYAHLQHTRSYEGKDNQNYDQHLQSLMTSTLGLLSSLQQFQKQGSQGPSNNTSVLNETGMGSSRRQTAQDGMKKLKQTPLSQKRAHNLSPNFRAKVEMAKKRKTKEDGSSFTGKQPLTPRSNQEQPKQVTIQLKPTTEETEILKPSKASEFKYKPQFFKGEASPVRQARQLHGPEKQRREYMGSGIRQFESRGSQYQLGELLRQNSGRSGRLIDFDVQSQRSMKSEKAKLELRKKYYTKNLNKHSQTNKPRMFNNQERRHTNSEQKIQNLAPLARQMSPEAQLRRRKFDKDSQARKVQGLQSSPKKCKNRMNLQEYKSTSGNVFGIEKGRQVQTSLGINQPVSRLSLPGNQVQLHQSRLFKTRQQSKSIRQTLPHTPINHNTNDPRSSPLRKSHGIPTALQSRIASQHKQKPTRSPAPKNYSTRTHLGVRAPNQTSLGQTWKAPPRRTLKLDLDDILSNDDGRQVPLSDRVSLLQSKRIQVRKNS